MKTEANIGRAYEAYDASRDNSYAEADAAIRAIKSLFHDFEGTIKWGSLDIAAEMLDMMEEDLQTL